MYKPVIMEWKVEVVKDFAPKFLHSVLCLVAQSCLTLCNPVDCSPLGSSVHGIYQARTLEWVAISFSNARKWNVKVKLLSRVWLFTTPWTAALQSSSVHGVFQARKEWVAIAFSKGVHRCVDLSLGFAFKIQRQIDIKGIHSHWRGHNRRKTITVP